MCKELPGIPINKVVDPKRIIRKMEGQGGEEAQGVADPQKKNNLSREEKKEATSSSRFILREAGVDRVLAEGREDAVRRHPVAAADLIHQGSML
jgi:hypothetical protein